MMQQIKPPQKPPRVIHVRGKDFTSYYCTGFSAMASPVDVRLSFMRNDSIEQNDRVLNANDDETRNVEQSKLQMLGLCEIIMPVAMAKQLVDALS